MNRRGFLAGLGALIVAGPEAKRAYSFITKNPLALRGLAAWVPDEASGPYFGVDRVKPIRFDIGMKLKVLYPSDTVERAFYGPGVIQLLEDQNRELITRAEREIYR